MPDLVEPDRSTGLEVHVDVSEDGLHVVYRFVFGPVFYAVSVPLSSAPSFAGAVNEGTAAAVKAAKTGLVTDVSEVLGSGLDLKGGVR